MATKFEAKGIYLGEGKIATEIYVSAIGNIISKEEFEQAADQLAVKLEGFITPAFRDGHSHPLFAGRESRGLDISACTNDEELIAALRSYSSKNPELSWIDAAVFDRSLNMTFTRDTLDLAVPDKPVVLHGDDHHTLWVNSKALEVAGILTTDLPILDSGHIDIDTQGMPTGILREWPAMSLVMDHAPKLTLTEDVQALLWADKAMAEAGIVECVDAWIDRGMSETYLAAFQSGELELDYTLCFRADPDTFTEDLNYFIDMRTALEATNGKMAGSCIKFFADGVFGSATALVSEPYESNGLHGKATWPEQSFKEAIQLAHQNGFQIHIHAIGDAATNLALDIIGEQSGFYYPPVIAHAELTDGKTLDRMAALGVVACVQPYWAQNNGLLLSCVDHLGKARLERLYAFKDMFSKAITTVFSSDWPISTYNPIKGLAVAVNRRENSNQVVHNPAQAISPKQAIDAYTTNVSKMIRSPKSGCLAIGQPFDAVLLNQDILAVRADELIETKVLATYKAGKAIFSLNP